MKRWYNRHKKAIWWTAVAGVPIAYIGIWFNNPSVACVGMILALPLYLIVLPFCLFLLAAWITHPLWYPFYWLVIKRNGAPFQPGDVVRILRGRHKGKVVPIYAVWSERHQVRVELGEQEKEDFTDVLCFVWIRKVQGANNAPGIAP